MCRARPTNDQCSTNYSSVPYLLVNVHCPVKQDSCSDPVKNKKLICPQFYQGYVRFVFPIAYYCLSRPHYLTNPSPQHPKTTSPSRISQITILPLIHMRLLTITVLVQICCLLKE